jgi:hypothetical protein
VNENYGAAADSFEPPPDNGMDFHVETPMKIPAFFSDNSVVGDPKQICITAYNPADGGQPVIIAYLYGGQGTINVQSWSPDSRMIAFVSNTIFKDRVRK